MNFDQNAMNDLLSGVAFLSLGSESEDLSVFDLIILHSLRSSSILYIEYFEAIFPAEMALVSKTRLLVLPEAFHLTD